jgi:hypothetical protein
MGLTKHEAIIIDIDGTVALHPHRGHHEYHKVLDDIPHEPVVSIVHTLIEKYVTKYILFVSGRPDSCRDDSEKWLTDNRLYFDKLFMRKHGDYRPDDIVKKEIYDNEIKDQYDVFFVVDDRDRVVKMWRSLGLTCLQVADGNF